MISSRMSCSFEITLISGSSISYLDLEDSKLSFSIWLKECSSSSLASSKQSLSPNSKWSIQLRMESSRLRFLIFFESLQYLEIWTDLLHLYISFAIVGSRETRPFAYALVFWKEKFCLSSNMKSGCKSSLFRSRSSMSFLSARGQAKLFKESSQVSIGLCLIFS